MTDNLLTAEQLGELLQISQRTIYRYNSQGLPYKQVGRQYLYKLDDVEQWLAAKHQDTKRYTLPLNMSTKYYKLSDEQQAQVLAKLDTLLDQALDQ